MKKLTAFLVTFLALIALIGTASATLEVFSVQPGIADDGNFVASPAKISFYVVDSNSDAINDGNQRNNVRYFATIRYATSTRATYTSVVSDLNLGNGLANSSACDSNIGTTGTYCSYSWDSDSITDANYYIDVNVTWYWGGSGVNETAEDYNNDSNYSFYSDTTVPSCEFEEERGNQYTWSVINEAPAEDLGSVTTLYYSVDDAVTFSSATATTSLAGNLLNGKHTYRCYATDSAGNTSATDEETHQYPNPNSVTLVGGGGSALAAAITAQNISQTVQENPIIIGLVLVGAFLLFGKKGKKRKSRKKR